ncbi:uncharacterized protein [Heterodontus francisci]|uniref:uncharacterized protein isoform X2 n=1 Tax=Heterodontus francisci TaxID=7792 RepID=UPI00355C14DD
MTVKTLDRCKGNSEVDPETWSSTITDIKLKLELPEVHIQSGEDAAALAASLCGGDGLSCGTASSVARYEREEYPTVMDKCERGDPAANKHQGETKCSYLLCRSVKQSTSTDGLFSALANEMCIENGASGDVSEENMCTKVLKCGAKLPATLVKHTELDKSVEAESTGEALTKNKLVVVPLHAAATEKLAEVELLQEVPFEDDGTGDVPDQFPSAAAATSHLHAENEVANEVPVEGAAANGMLAENGLAEAPSYKTTVKLPVEGEVTTDVLAESQVACEVLEGEVIRECVACTNLGEAQLADVSVDTAHRKLTAEDEVTIEVKTTNGAVEGMLTLVSSDNTEALEMGAEDEVTRAMPVEDAMTSGTLAENQLATEVLVEEETNARFVTFEFLAEHKLTDAPTTEAVPSRVASTTCSLPKKRLPELPPDTTVEMSVKCGLPSEDSVEKVMASILFGENELADVPTDTTAAAIEVSAEDELTTVSVEDIVADQARTESELADTSDTTAAMEVYTAVEMAMEVGITTSSPLAERQLAGEALAEVETAEHVTCAVLVDGELVDIPTDIVVTEMTAENEDDKTTSLEVATTKGTLAENGLFMISPDSTGPAQAVLSHGVTTSRVFSENGLVVECLAPIEDEKVREVPFEDVLADSILEVVSSNHSHPNMRMAAEGEVIGALANDDADGELMVARNATGECIKGVVESKISDEISSSTSRKKQSESLTFKGHNVCAYIERDATCCKGNGHQGVELNRALESVSLPFTHTVRAQCREQEISCLGDKHGQTVMHRSDTLGEFGTAPVHMEAAICSVKLKALRSTNRRKEFVRLKMRKLNHTVLLSNCTQNFPKLAKFWINRTSGYMDCCSRESNCDVSDVDHKVQQMEEIKPKNLPLQLINNLARSKWCGKPLLLEHLSTIANDLNVFSKCLEMQEEFSRASDLIIAMGMCSRFQFQNVMDLQFCSNTDQRSYLDTCYHLSTPSKNQSISLKPLAPFYRKDQHWPFTSNCTQSVHFITPIFPISSHLNLASLLSLYAGSSETVDHCCVSERTGLSIIPQHSSQDSWKVSQCQASFGKTFCPPASPFKAGRCLCTRSKFGLHTVLALSSPACYRLWTRQRHFGRVPNAQRPFLTQFGESLKRLILPVHSDKSFWSLSYTLGGVLSWWNQHSPSCVSTFNINASNNCRRNSPSFRPSYLITGNGTNLSEAKSLLILQTNKTIDLQHLNFACVKEPYLALPDPPTSSPECTVTNSTFSSASPFVPSITYVETQLHSEQKEESAPPDKSVSKSKGSLRKVSQIRIRKRAPKQDTNLTPMGLPKPKRLKKKEFSLEEIYTNQNYKSPSAHSKYLETIFEEPILKKGSFVCTSLQKRKRLLEFQDYTLPRKRRAHAGVKVQSRTRGRKATTREGEIDSLLVQKLTELETFLAGED